jgi:hypothetical protein
VIQKAIASTVALQRFAGDLTREVTKSDRKSAVELHRHALTDARILRQYLRYGGPWAQTAAFTA